MDYLDIICKEMFRIQQRDDLVRELNNKNYND